MTFRSILKSASVCLAVALSCIFVGSAHADFVTVWQAGAVGRGWPRDGGGDGGGPNVDFVQEGGINAPPGDPNSGPGDKEADDDYYFAGTYPAPINTVANDEISFERAFAGTDLDLRIHFNLPSDLNPADELRFSFEPENLHGQGGTEHFGVQVSFNGNVIFPELTITSADLNTVFVSDAFTAGSVGALGGPGVDNIISLRGINHNADGDGGGNWLGFEFHSLERDAAVIPEPSTLVLISLGGILLLPLLKRRRMAKQA